VTAPKKTTTTEKIHPNVADKKFKCPDCSNSYDRASALGNHRRSHGYRGTHPESVKSRSQTLAKKRLAEAINTEPVSLITTDQPAENGERQVSNGNGKRVSRATAVEVPPVDFIAYALTVGSLKEFCRNSAEEHGIPSREFTRQCAELFYRETRR
jgi:hypothetical protein